MWPKTSNEINQIDYYEMLNFEKNIFFLGLDPEPN